MNPTNHFNFCSRCKGDLEIVKKDLELKCKNCGYTFYLNPIPCNGLILINKNNEILLITRKYDPGKGLIDVPGGFVDPGETLEESTKREAKEELDFVPEKLEYVGSYYDTYLFQGVNSPTLCAVFATETDFTDFKALDDVGEIKFYKFEEVENLDFAFPYLKKAISDYLKKKRYNS